jgi:hypothetical protein
VVLVEVGPLIVKKKLACPSDPKSYAGEALAHGRASHARQVKG